MTETTTGTPILILETPADLPAAMAALTEAYELHTKHKRKLRDAVARAEKKYQPDVYASGKVLDQLEREVEEFCRDQRDELLAHLDTKTLEFGVASIEFRQTPPKVQCDTKKV
ncbi:MAG: host-nuclease inhibitor Gam family protein, partial [Bacteroidota bacterium]